MSRSRLSVAALAALVVSYLALTVWWLTQDGRVPDFDSGTHMLLSLQYRDAFGDGRLLEWFTASNTYAPLAHLFGAAATALLGIAPASYVLAHNVVFVPLLALGCFGAGRIVGGTATGLLAAAFALGTPMVVSAFHGYLLDAPEAALVAVSVWMLLASRRLELPWWALGAGVAAGLAAMTKQTAPFFVVGIVAVVLARGGWRNTRGMLALAAGAAIVAGPWYLYHLPQQWALSGSVTTGATPLWYGDVPFPARLSPADFAWYLWSSINAQLYLPFFLLGLAGAVGALVAFVRRPSPDDLAPELLGGLAAGAVLSVAVAYNDPRYSLPTLVYVAVLAAWGTQRLPRGWPRTLAGAAIVAFALVNVATTSFGWGGVVRVSLPGAPGDPIHSRELTIVSDTGYVLGAPEAGGDVAKILKRAREDGARAWSYDALAAQERFFNGGGLVVLGRGAGLPAPNAGQLSLLGPDDVFLSRRTIAQGDPEPCSVLPDGSGLYVTRGPELVPPAYATNLYCPLRSPRTYVGPLAGEALPEPTAQEARDRRALRRALEAARRDGRREVVFEDTLAIGPTFGGTAGLRELAESAGLELLVGDPSAAGEDAFVVLRRPIVPDSPDPCVRLTDGHGVWFRGPGTRGPLEYADDLYCPTRTPKVYAGKYAGGA